MFLLLPFCLLSGYVQKFVLGHGVEVTLTRIFSVVFLVAQSVPARHLLCHFHCDQLRILASLCKREAVILFSLSIAFTMYLSMS